jgi:hypothetical protein
VVAFSFSNASGYGNADDYGTAMVAAENGFMSEANSVERASMDSFIWLIAENSQEAVRKFLRSRGAPLTREFKEEDHEFDTSSPQHIEDEGPKHHHEVGQPASPQRRLRRSE